MEVKMCDFCGRILEDSKRSSVIPSGESKLNFKIDDSPRVGRQLYDLDLCYKCTKKMQEFLDSNMKKA